MADTPKDAQKPDTADANKSAAENGSASSQPDPAKQRARRKRLLIFGTLTVVAAIGGFAYWLYSRNYESTDDAFIQSDIVMIAPKVGGTVSAVHIVDNQRVAAGDPLLELDPRDYQAAANQAQANLESAEAQLDSAKADLSVTRASSSAGIGQAAASLRAAQAEAGRARADASRYQTLFAKDEIAKQVLDQAVTTSRSADAKVEEARSQLANAQTAPQQVSQREAAIAGRQAQVAQAQAALDQALLNLSYTHIVAPSAGRVTRKNVLIGAQVAAGGPLLALVHNDPWVIANFKETQLSKMRPGQPVTFSVDSFPSGELRGCVDSFQTGTGPTFSLLPPENATGNYVKVVQRVPVKLIFEPAPDASHNLLPGMSVVPTVHISVDPTGQDDSGNSAIQTCRTLLKNSGNPRGPLVKNAGGSQPATQP